MSEGTSDGMDEQTGTGEQDAARLEAVQAVVDRVTSWQDGATEGTVAEELRRGFDEAGVDVPDDQVAALADAIESRHGAVDAAEVVGTRPGG